MSIAAGTIISNVRALKDDVNTTALRYPDAHVIPAVNLAVSYIVSLFNAAFEMNKISPESLSELINVEISDVSLTSGQSHAKAEVANKSTMWTLFGVDPSPQEDSDKLLASTKKWATRMTLAQWNMSLEDPFAAGAEQNNLDLVTGGYIGPGNFMGDSKYYVLLRPASLFPNGGKVGLWYLKNPTLATTTASVIEFPVSLTDLLTQKTLQYLSFKNEQDYVKITDRDIMQLVTLMNG